MLTRPSDNPFHRRFEWLELAPYAFDMRGDGVVVQNDIGGIHQLLTILDMPRITRQGMHDPKFSQRQRDRSAVPGGLHLLAVDRQCTAPYDLSGIVGPTQGIDAPEQRRDARRQMRQADILGEEVIGAEPQSRDCIEFAVPGGQKDDGQLRRQRPQIAAQIESAFGLILQRYVDNGQIRQANVERLHGGLAIAIGLDRIAVASQRRRVILAQSRLVLDNGDLLFHR